MNTNKEMQRSVITDVVRGLMLSINGITGAETLKTGNGLRDIYSAVEQQLGFGSRQMPDEVKEMCRFEFDKLITHYTSGDGDYVLQRVGQKYGARDGKAFSRRNATWRNDNIPVTAYPKVVAQLGEDLKRLEKSLNEANAIGNRDGAAKIAGRIRQTKNNKLILEGEYNEFTSQVDANKELASA
jgi:hypothetical protein